MSSDSFTRLEIPRLSGPPLDQERERARLRGHAAGYAEGMRLAAADAARAAAARDERAREADAADRARVATALAALEAAARDLTARADALVAPAEARLHALAVELAEAVVASELSAPVRSALAVAARIEQAAIAGDEPVAHLNPADAETLERLGAAPAGIRVTLDPDLRPGDAVVRVTDGAIDLRIEAAFTRARAALSEGTR